MKIAQIGDYPLRWCPVIPLSVLNIEQAKLVSRMSSLFQNADWRALGGGEATKTCLM